MSWLTDLNDKLKGAQTQTPTATGGVTQAKPTGATGLSGALSLIPGVGGILSTGLNIAQQVAPYFQTSPQGMAKIDATKMQQTFEKTANDIQAQVEAGTMSVDIALQRLQSLRQAIAGSVGGSGQNGGYSPSASAGGATTALFTIDNIIANLQDKQHWQTSKNLQEMGGNKLGASGMANLQPTEQTAMTKSAIANKLLGYKVGNDALAGSPVGNIMDRMQTPVEDRFKSAVQVGQEQLPAAPNTLTDLRKSLMSKLGVGGGN